MKKTKGAPRGFALTSGAKPAQFSPRVRGQNETGFKQKTLKQTTAAMQGRGMPSDRTMADAGPRKDAKKQFKKAPGKRVF